jgi:hypothetical protein
MEALLDIFHKATAVAALTRTYMEIHGVCIILVMLRILKLLDFQPRLGLVTRTIKQALTDLIHFGLMTFVILGVFVCMTYFLFGSSVQRFSTPGKAFIKNWDLLQGDTDGNEALIENYPLSGPVFVYSFNVIVFFVLLNILLAILVEAYMKVAEEGGNTLSVPQEVWSLCKSVWRSTKWARDYKEKHGNMFARHAITDEEIIAAIGGHPDEDQYDESGRLLGYDAKKHTVFKVPTGAGGDDDDQWLDCQVHTILKALEIHPEVRSKGLDRKTLYNIACSMVFRYGTKGTDPIVTGDFSSDQLAAMDAMMELGHHDSTTIEDESLVKVTAFPSEKADMELKNGESKNTTDFQPEHPAPSQEIQDLYGTPAYGMELPDYGGDGTSVELAQPTGEAQQAAQPTQQQQQGWFGWG